MDDRTAPTAEAQVPDELTPSRASRHARRRRWWVWIIVALVLAALAVAGVSVAREFDRVRRAQARVDAASALLEKAEEGLLTVDEAVQTEISSEIATQAADALAVAETVKADALAAAAILDEAASDLPEESLALAEALRESAVARADMMAEAPVILEADRKAASAIAPADSALEEIKAAEEYITKAVAEFNKHTEAGVKQSTVNSTEAEKRLRAARSQIETATAAFPEADFSAFEEYIDAKIALAADSKEIDALWLAGKIEESNRRLDAYNKKDAEIVAMAKALPASIRDPIADAYETLTAGAREAYFDARERARQAGDRVAELREQQTE
ncbi:MAG: hypothetical protein JW733_00745 [Coriobacteriia bacterium]|nr:hypothetical protein [Coriobacteriia bacterium]